MIGELIKKYQTTWNRKKEYRDKLLIPFYGDNKLDYMKLHYLYTTHPNDTYTLCGFERTYTTKKYKICCIYAISNESDYMLEIDLPQEYVWLVKKLRNNNDVKDSITQDKEVFRIGRMDAPKMRYMYIEFLT